MICIGLGCPLPYRSRTDRALMRSSNNFPRTREGKVRRSRENDGHAAATRAARGKSLGRRPGGRVVRRGSLMAEGAHGGGARGDGGPPAPAGPPPSSNDTSPQIGQKEILAVGLVGKNVFELVPLSFPVLPRFSRSNCRPSPGQTPPGLSPDGLQSNSRRLGCCLATRPRPNPASGPNFAELCCLLARISGIILTPDDIPALPHKASHLSFLLLPSSCRRCQAAPQTTPLILCRMAALHGRPQFFVASTTTGQGRDRSALPPA